MHDRAIREIELEIGQIDQLLISYDDLLERVQVRDPDLVELTAVASVLHSFYNGLENIFLSIAKRIDADVPEGPQWHRDLLTQMTKSTSLRAAVMTPEMAERLANYLAFRHFYRHSYSFFLEWDELEGMIVALEDTWDQVKNQLLQFTGNMT